MPIFRSKLVLAQHWHQGATINGQVGSKSKLCHSRAASTSSPACTCGSTPDADFGKWNSCCETKRGAAMSKADFLEKQATTTEKLMGLILKPDLDASQVCLKNISFKTMTTTTAMGELTASLRSFKKTCALTGWQLAFASSTFVIYCFCMSVIERKTIFLSVPYSTDNSWGRYEVSINYWCLDVTQYFFSDVLYARI